MSQVTEQSVRFQPALASIKLIQASAVLDLTEDDFDFLTSNIVWIATDRSRAHTLSLHDALPISKTTGSPPSITDMHELVVPRSIPKTLRSEEHTSELQSLAYLVCRLLLEKKDFCRFGFNRR